MNRHLHIVCLDVPWPADYGGAIDMMYRIMALHKAGIRIHLHYFIYNERGNPNELNRYCESIHIYERKKPRTAFPFRVPYIVASRTNKELANNLNKDNHPILLEGVHCTGILPLIEKAGRKIIVRLHNEESVYYKELAHSENAWLRKLYLLNESRLLKKYQSSLPDDIAYACITDGDVALFKNNYGLARSFLLPAFTPYQQVKCIEGQGTFCLYHGNLGVPENEKAAMWLLERVFSKIKVPFVVAGKNPSKRLDTMAHLYMHTCMVANPSETELNDLVQKAHINILPSFNKTGIKIKLLHALFEGRHCVVNDAMVEGTGLESACHIGAGADAFASIILQLQHLPFAEEEIRLRKNLLGHRYDTEANARLLIQYLY
ncbi:MAG TPA: glycosyltransferase family 4 protein [Chitinophagaceae bacterium]|nr:glycosyltransferase family 4 protein [Chitinophagaceae bacterium]